MALNVTPADRNPVECTAMIIVPETALSEPGHIRTVAIHQTGQSKHEFHALAQMAFISFDDGELEARQQSGPLTITVHDETLQITDGLVIGRLPSGEVTLLSNARQSPRKYLEAANRYCTRWIRLDI
jgi:hypothetical protein